MDPEFLLAYAAIVATLSLIFLGVAAIVGRLSARNFSARLTKRNALTYALHVVNDDQRVLAAHLAIQAVELVDYLRGKREVPIPVFRKAIQLILDKTQADDATQGEVLRKIKEFNSTKK